MISAINTVVLHLKLENCIISFASQTQPNRKYLYYIRGFAAKFYHVITEIGVSYTFLFINYPFHDDG